MQISLLAPLKAKGLARVEWGNRALARLLKMPQPGAGIPVVLSVTQIGGEQIWDRRFGGDVFITRQHLDNGFLREQFGANATILKVEPNQDTLRFTSIGACLGNLRVPPSLAPQINATVTALGPKAWRAAVRISWRGTLICQYEAELEAE